MSINMGGRSLADSKSLLPAERRAAVFLAMIYAFRMLGLFMILPVFALYADKLSSATPLLVGLAIGIYGFTQALLQIPFGLMSDRYGRKVMIIIGLSVFALGSLLAAYSNSIYGVIMGRALQGAGAIAAVVMALAADLSRENQRTKMMAIIGVSIGGSFMLALILGPYLYIYIGVQGIFIFTAILAVIGMCLVIFMMPKPQKQVTQTASFRTVLAKTAKQKGLLSLIAGIMILHLVLTASFVVLPFLLRDIMQINENQHWLVYLLVMTGSLLIAVPCIVLADRLQRDKAFISIAIFVMLLSVLGLAMFLQHMVFLGVCLLLFFSAFNFLEASLPAAVSKLAQAENKGAAMGLYSSSQFFGAFLGGVLGGWILGQYDIKGVMLMSSLILGIWLMIAAGIRAAKPVNT